MAENRLRKPQKKEENRLISEQKKERGKALINIENIFDTGLSIKYLPHLIYVAVLGVIYISNSHSAETMIRKLNKLETEVENLRSDYSSLEVDYTSAGVQSEITARAKKELNLIENDRKTKKIIIQNEDE